MIYNPNTQYIYDEDIISVSSNYTTDDEYIVDPQRKSLKQLTPQKKNSYSLPNHMTPQNINNYKKQDLYLLHTESNPEIVKYKTQMCENWIKKGQCNYGKKCKFAHGCEERKDLIPQGSNQFYKTRPCNTFHTKGYCPYGFRCHFQHDIRQVDEIQKKYIYQKYLKAYKRQENSENLSDSLSAISKKNYFEKIIEEKIIEQSSFKPKRLPIFENICNQNNLQQQQYYPFNQY